MYSAISSHLNDDMVKLVNRFKQENNKLTVYREGDIFFVEPEEIFYFESVDQKVFAYCEEAVYEVKSRLYELMEELPERGKSMVKSCFTAGTPHQCGSV